MQSLYDRSVLLGIPVDNLNMDGTINRIMSMVDQYRHDRRNRLVATANVDFIINSHSRKKRQQSAELLDTLRSADLVTADGMPLVWLSRLLGRPLPERITGADLVPALAEQASLIGKSVYFFGGNKGSAKQTAKLLSERHPELKVAGYSAPMIDMDDNLENMIEIARINITNPDILFIALGNPKQELWFKRYSKYLKVPVSMGIGGTFEFISGQTSRAPRWMQKTGFEWIYRMLQDPRRLIKRYIIGLFNFNLMVLPLIILNWLGKLFNRGSEFLITDIQPIMPGDRNYSQLFYNLTRLKSVKIKPIMDREMSQLTLDFNAIHFIHASEVYYLMNMLMIAQQMGVKLELVNLRLIPRLLLRVYRIADLLENSKNHATKTVAEA